MLSVRYPEITKDAETRGRGELCQITRSKGGDYVLRGLGILGMA